MSSIGDVSIRGARNAPPFFQTIGENVESSYAQACRAQMFESAGARGVGIRSRERAAQIPRGVVPRTRAAARIDIPACRRGDSKCKVTRFAIRKLCVESRDDPDRPRSAWSRRARFAGLEAEGAAGAIAA
jgi:hypothetical protein